MGHEKASGEIYRLPAAPGNTGDATRAAQAIGAAVALMDKAWGGPVVLTPPGQVLFLVGERWLPFSIIVDSKGERFWQAGKWRTKSGADRR